MELGTLGEFNNLCQAINGPTEGHHKQHREAIAMKMKSVIISMVLSTVTLLYPVVPVSASHDSFSTVSIRGDSSSEASAVITNTGYLAGMYQASLRLNDEIIETRALTLEGLSSETVTFTTTRSVAGTGTVRIEGLTGTFAVTEPAVEPESELQHAPQPTTEAEPEPIPEPVPEPIPGPTPHTGIEWWVWLLVGIAVISVLVVGYLYWWKPQ